ncbi:MAG: hypothetical protein PsegKO_03640 [Pseudohongiellaceae bacterium]
MARSQAVRKSQAPNPAERFEFPGVLHWVGLATPAAWLLFFLLALVLVSGLLVVRTTHQNRFAFNELQELKDEAVDLDVAWGQLLIEQSTFGVEGRIEQKAAAQLDMRVPDIADIVMVEND